MMLFHAPRGARARSRPNGLALLFVAAAVVATGGPVGAATPCDKGATGSPGVADADGRLFGHFAYATVARAMLVRPGLPGAAGCGLVHRQMAADLARLLAAARRDRAGGGAALTILSCFRSPARQARLFCNRGALTDIVRRAVEVAPPGHSEHATGLAVDFGDRRGRCDLKGCFADAPAGRWLLANAPAFGFELSFPANNAQGVAFEPWHWRWIGPGDAAADTPFAAARLFNAAPIEAGAMRPVAAVALVDPTHRVEREEEDDD